MTRREYKYLLIPVVLLLIIGLVMQSSISPVMPKAKSKGDLFHFWLQVRYVLAGGMLCLVCSYIPYTWWKKFAWVGYFAVIVLLAFCFIPPIGIKLNGARRWLDIGFTFQPSELAKVTTLVAVSAWCSRYGSQQRQFLVGFAYPLLAIVLPVGLIAFEVDLGNAALVCVSCLAVLHAAGARKTYLTVTCVVLLGVAASIIYFVPEARERIGRLTAFLDLEAHKTGEGQQQYHSVLALGSAGPAGRGLGDSVEKRGNGLTYSNSDFIYPVIGEELGIAASMGIILCYFALTFGAFRVAQAIMDRFGQLLAYGLAMLVACQAILHIGVCLAWLPNKGTALPFISAGGTCLVTYLGAIGLLFSIYRKAEKLSPQRYVSTGVPVAR